MSEPLWDMRAHAIRGIPLVAAGDSIGGLIGDAIVSAGLSLADGDVVVVASKVVSKAEGRTLALASVTPSPDAVVLGQQTGRDPRLCQVILDEAHHVVEVNGRHIVTVDRHGMRNTSAGVDRSNTISETVVLLPLAPDVSARRIREHLHQTLGVTVAVIITDTFGSPFRYGGTGAAIGIAGIAALEQTGPGHDLDGNPGSPVTNRVDELAAAGSVLMGQMAEATPFVVIRGASYTGDDDATITGLIIDQTRLDYTHRLPAKRVAAAVLFHDDDGRHLLVHTAYKAGWELPGGIVEKGESPYAAAVREIGEELGLDIVPGRLLAVDWVPERDGRTDGLMLVYDGGTLTPQQTATIRLPADELQGWQWCDAAQEKQHLIPLLARRAAAARQARADGSTVYLEDGFPVATARFAEPAEAIDAGLVCLRRWQSGDATALAEAVTASASELAPWLAFAQTQPYTEADAAAYITQAGQRWQRQHSFTYAIAGPAGQLLGCIHLRRYEASPEVSLGYWLDSRHTSHGYATAAVRALTAEALRTGAASVRIEHDAANPASGAVAQRCGFTRIHTGPGRRPQFGARTGTETLWRYPPPGT